ncbi:MAG: hypothetical protein LLF97_04070 [Planctomycetaceae bacterium]|nr:hypothetical protein [Planctomycetaceae bacterium]
MKKFVCCLLILWSAWTAAAATSDAVPKKVGVLLVSHGSRSDSWRKMLTDIEDAVRDDVLKDGRVARLRSAFMEYKEPSIATQMKAFDRDGCTEVVVVPLLLSVSSHSFDDIPTILGQKQDRRTSDTLRLEGIAIYRPKAHVTIAPLLDFPAVLEQNAVRRVRQMSRAPAEEGVVLVVYGSTEYEAPWKKMVDRVTRAIQRDAGIDCVRHAWCGHIVRYRSEPTAEAIRDVLGQKQRALVVPLLVAVDETFQGRIIGGAVHQVDSPDRIVYRRDAILPDENVNRWIVDITRELVSQLQ